MAFQIHALPIDDFRPLFSLSDARLAQRRARRVRVTSRPGIPCRVSLIDAAVGEDVILTHFVHQPASGPYRASHAIFVRVHAVQARPDVDEIPALFHHRLISVRAFDAAHDMVAADIAPAGDLRGAIEELLEPDRVDYLHLSQREARLLRGPSDPGQVKASSARRSGQRSERRSTHARTWSSRISIGTGPTRRTSR